MSGGLWQTVEMTNQVKEPQHREDQKVKKLMERIERKQELQTKAARQQTVPSKN
jgi:hypothetical protein